jgi:hypothetical protein
MSVPFFSDQSVRALSSIERGTKRVSSKQVHLAGFEGDEMAEVRLQEGESLENALRRFKRKVMTEDIIKLKGVSAPTNQRRRPGYFRLLQMITGSEDRISSLSILFSIAEVFRDEFSAFWN